MSKNSLNLLRFLTNSLCKDQKIQPIHFLLSALCITAALAFLMSNRDFMLTDDDVSFPQQLASFNSISEYLQHRYNNWSGRLLIDLLLPLILDTNIWLWRLLNTLVLGCLLICIFTINNLAYACTQNKKWIWFIWILFFVFFLIKTDVMVWGAFWATGSLNYLWATSFFLVSILPFLCLLLEVRIPCFLWIIVIVCSSYASFQEQTSLLLLCFTILVLITNYIRNKPQSLWGISITCICMINFFLLLHAPGNSVRFEVEAQKFFPHFSAVPLYAKAILGYNYTLHNHFFYESVKQFLFIPFLTFYLSTKRQVPFPIKILSLYSCIFTIISIIFARGLGGNFSSFMNYDMYDNIIECSNLQISNLNLPILALSLLAFTAIPISWCFLLNNRNFLMIMLFFFFAALISSFALSASPTMYASGYRIFFVPDVMISITALLLINASIEDLLNYKKSFLLTFFILAVLSTANMITIYNRSIV